MRYRIALAAGLTASVLQDAGAQRRVSADGVSARPATGCRAPAMSCYGVPVSPAAQQAAAPSPWTVAASALLPGLGQAAQRTDRALGYLAVEVFAWTGYAWFSTDSRRHRDAYRQLASTVARSGFSTYRPNGDFTYYERMSHYTESGRFDMVPGGAVDPETDAATYNGSVWELARRTYWSDPEIPPDHASPEWQRSIEFYQARAYTQVFRWSWAGAPADYAAFKSRIEESNDANRRSVQALGLVIANHVLSAVDAYIVVRLRGQDGSSGLAVQGSIPLATFGARRTRGRVPD